MAISPSLNPFAKKGPTAPPAAHRTTPCSGCISLPSTLARAHCMRATNLNPHAGKAQSAKLVTYPAFPHVKTNIQRTTPAPSPNPPAKKGPAAPQVSPHTTPCWAASASPAHWQEHNASTHLKPHAGKAHKPTTSDAVPSPRETEQTASNTSPQPELTCQAGSSGTSGGAPYHSMAGCIASTCCRSRAASSSASRCCCSMIWRSRWCSMRAAWSNAACGCWCAAARARSCSSVRCASLQACSAAAATRNTTV